MLGFLKKWNRARRIAAVEVSDSLWARVEARLPFLDYLNADDRARLRELARGFVTEKQFHGAQGMELSDEVMLGIALQACLPILHKGLDAYSGWVGVVVYPGDFVIPREEMDEAGVVHEYDDQVMGEAWEGGPVLVSWHEGDDAPDGVNVVIHEFAHKLDMANGSVDGFPPLPAGMSSRVWSKVFNKAYEQFCQQVDDGEDTLLDPYGAEHPAEFFAVASEAFFEVPAAFQEELPDVYGQLRDFYGVDPAVGERRMMQIEEGSWSLKHPATSGPENTE